MKTPTNKATLHLVNQNATLSIQARDVIPAQTALFPSLRQHILVFVAMSRVSANEFEETFRSLMPHLVVDIRRFPRFDIENLNREVAFGWFEQAHAKYIDLHLTDDKEQGASLHISTQLAETAGPIMVLIEAKQYTSNVVSDLTRQFTEKSEKTWSVVQVPHHNRLAL